jgi:CMP-N-acetylneuraminic acid synthetase
MSMKHAEFIAIIPARGGSKRLPGKNIRPLAGKPLIGWAIEAALSVPVITEVMVTTDDTKIADVAKQFGAQIPFLRPAALSSETAGTTEVILHTLEYYRNERSTEFEFLILLQPTSPLREAQDIIDAITVLKSKNADAVVSVSPCQHSPLWSNTLPEDQSLKNFLPEKWLGVRSQDLPQYFRLNGAIYICRVKAFEEQRSLFLKDSIFAYPMPVEKSVDIDSEVDFVCAEFLKQQDIKLGKS